MKKIIFVALVGILVIGLGLWMRTRSSDSKNTTAGKLLTAQPNLTSNAVPPGVSPVDNNKPNAFTEPRPGMTPEEESLQKMVTGLAKYYQGPSFDSLIRDLQESGQEPFIARDKNEYTGELSIVRTKSPFPGTRYFHAQYFTDEKGDRYLQHMSFEFRPGPKALESARQAVYNAFPGIGSPSKEIEGFMEWKLNTGFTVWIKKMELENLDPQHPFNAYSKKDVGTIRVAIEEDPHAGMDGH